MYKTSVATFTGDDTVETTTQVELVARNILGSETAQELLFRVTDKCKDFPAVEDCKSKMEFINREFRRLDCLGRHLDMAITIYCSDMGKEIESIPAVELPNTPFKFRLLLANFDTALCKIEGYGIPSALVLYSLEDIKDGKLTCYIGAMPMNFALFLKNKNAAQFPMYFPEYLDIAGPVEIDARKSGYWFLSDYPNLKTYENQEFSRNMMTHKLFRDI